VKYIIVYLHLFLLLPSPPPPSSRYVDMVVAMVAKVFTDENVTSREVRDIAKACSLIKSIVNNCKVG